MDRFTRNYTIFITVLVIALFIWVFYENPDVSTINAQLEADQELANYPYPFRVISLKNGTATLGSPRSVEFPVYRALGILFPHLAGRSPDDPELMKAQQELARIQKKARTIVMKSPKVKNIEWQLDKNWLTRHGAQFLISQASIMLSASLGVVTHSAYKAKEIC